MVKLVFALPFLLPWSQVSTPKLEAYILGRYKKNTRSTTEIGLVTMILCLSTQFTYIYIYIGKHICSTNNNLPPTTSSPKKIQSHSSPHIHGLFSSSSHRCPWGPNRSGKARLWARHAALPWEAIQPRRSRSSTPSPNVPAGFLGWKMWRVCEKHAFRNPENILKYMATWQRGVFGDVSGGYDF